MSNPVKLLQSVRVGMSPAAGVETIEGTTISVSAAGDSSAADTKYDAAQAVGELPVRVSLQYRAGDKSGSDLTELQGHTGPVEIDLTRPSPPRSGRGSSRTTPRAKPAPIPPSWAPRSTIAASTKLTGVRADDVTAGSADGGTGTNGVLSSTEDGATVVQWATVLAPPRSGASTTLRLVADVKDFQVPAFDVAVQPGLNTDLSADGVLAGAFSSGAGSEMGLQRRTISLVSDVNTVLTKAGSTITEVRQNLQETSQTLGAKTAGELRHNSMALAATMVDLKEQLKTLAPTWRPRRSQRSPPLRPMKLTVAAVDAMLGDTSAVPATAPINGDGRTAEVPKSGKAATVYSSIQTMASQLDAYAKVSAGILCNIVAGAIKATMGPEDPTAEECAEQGSMTCSLYGSAVTVTGALLGLVTKGDELVADLQPQMVEGAIKDQEAAAVTLEKVRADFAGVLDGAETTEYYTIALANVEEAIKSARGSVTATRDAAAAVRGSIDGLRQKLGDIKKTAQNARGELGDRSLLNGSMTQQTQRLADELCKMADGALPREGRLSAKQAERLRSYLTSAPCEPTDESGNPAQELRPPLGFKDPLDDRIQAQTAAWDAVLAATDTTAPDEEIGQAFTTLGTAIDDIDAKLDAINKATKALDGAATGDVNSNKRELVALDAALGKAIDSSGRVGSTLAKLKEQQDGLGDKIKSPSARSRPRPPLRSTRPWTSKFAVSPRSAMQAPTP